MTASLRGRVLRLITRLNIGGPARQALLLTRDLSNRWPTTLAAGRPSVQEGELTDPAVPIRRVPLVRPVHPLNDLRAVRGVRELVRDVQPIILHTHMAKAGAVGRLAVRNSDIRTVHTFHGHVLGGYFRKPIERMFLEVERRLARSTDVLIAISPEIREELLALGIGTPRQYEVIPLGFDLQRHLDVAKPSGELRTQIGIGRDVPLVGTVGRLVPIKDLTTLLRAMTFIPEAHLAILGDGEECHLLERRAVELGIADRTHFTGWWEDIPAAMSDLDVIALTSLNEGTPVSLIEALACGRPVVATDVGGVRFVVEHRRTGLLAQPRDVQGISIAIKEVLASSSLVRTFQQAGRAEVRARFHKDRLLSDIDGLYEDLVAKRVTS